MIEIFFVAGRVLFGALFLYNGVNHFRNYAAVRGYCTFKHVPMPGACTIISGVWLLVSGASVVLGFRPEAGLALIVVFLMIVTPVIHDFWNAADPAQRLGDMINFHKNAALLGATLMLLSLPRPWPYSL